MKEEILAFLNREINLKHIPGAVIQVAKNGDVLLREAVGNRYIYNGKSAPMEIDTVFDLASLTKVVATLPAMLKLLDKGIINLDDTMNSFLPEFTGNGKEEITIRQILTHTSGLPISRPIYSQPLSTEERLNAIYKETLDATPGSKVMYTDLGFIVLYRLIETVTNKSFEDFVEDEFFAPLEMFETQFCPPFSRERYAATEYSERLEDYKFGIVHDESAEEMEGISGHAGLFSTVDDLSKFATMMEEDGFYNGTQLLSPSSLTLARANFTAFDSKYRGLGWQLKDTEDAPCGDYFSSNSYGHTGYTGTSVWFDPEVQLHVILLTNRVHYGRNNHIFRLRPRLHNLIRSLFPS